jgi:transcription initiation factor TFIID TATA-box-binding protein
MPEKNTNHDFAVVNLVATTNMGQPIDLNALNMLPNIFYDPDVYHCAYIKDQNMKGKVSIFASGKLISIGTKNERAAIGDLKHVVKLLKKAGFIRRRRIKVEFQNLVVTVNLNKSIDLKKLQGSVASVIYEPEQFPAAIYKPDKSSSTTILVFASGKLVLLGIKSSKSLNKLVKHVVRQLESSIYRLANTN